MILSRETAISLFDFLRLGIALDTQNFVIVLLIISHCYIADCRFPIANLKTGERRSVYLAIPNSRWAFISITDLKKRRSESFFSASSIGNWKSAMPYLFSSTSTYSASITLSSPDPPDDDAPAADA